MNKPDKMGEPSMEEILASIRQIVAEDPVRDTPRLATPVPPPPFGRAATLGQVPPPAPGVGTPAVNATALPTGDALDRLAGAMKAPPAPAGRPAPFEDDLADLFDGGGEPAAPTLPVPRPATALDRAVPPAEPAFSLPQPSFEPQPTAAPAPAANARPAFETFAAAPPEPQLPLAKSRGFYPPQSYPPQSYSPQSYPTQAEPVLETPTARPLAGTAGVEPPLRREPTFAPLPPVTPAAEAAPETVAVPPPRSGGFFPANFMSRGVEPAFEAPAAAPEPQPMSLDDAIAALSREPRTPVVSEPAADPAPAPAPAAVPASAAAIPDVSPLLPVEDPLPQAAVASVAAAPAESPSPDLPAPDLPAPDLAAEKLQLSLGALAAGLAASAPTVDLVPEVVAAPDIIVAPAVAEPAAAAPVPAAAAIAPAELAPSPAAVFEAAEPAVSSAPAPRTLEDAVADMLRPMLKEWLAENMPRIVEKAVRNEVASLLPKTPGG